MVCQTSSKLARPCVCQAWSPCAVSAAAQVSIAAMTRTARCTSVRARSLEEHLDVRRQLEGVFGNNVVLDRRHVKDLLEEHRLLDKRRRLQESAKRLVVAKDRGTRDDAERCRAVRFPSDLEP